MSVSLKIPTPLRRMTNGESSATVEGTNIMECIDSLDALHPGIKARLVADSGNSTDSSTSTSTARTFASRTAYHRR